MVVVCHDNVLSSSVSKEVESLLNQYIGYYTGIHGIRTARIGAFYRVHNTMGWGFTTYWFNVGRGEGLLRMANAMWRITMFHWRLCSLFRTCWSTGSQHWVALFSNTFLVSTYNGNLSSIDSTFHLC